MRYPDFTFFYPSILKVLPSKLKSIKYENQHHHPSTIYPNHLIKRHPIPKNPSHNLFVKIQSVCTQLPITKS